MSENTPKRSYRQLEKRLIAAVLADLGVYLLYLLFAGLGIVWLKLTLAVVGIVAGILGCAFLVLIDEYKRRRSRWVLCAFGAIALCIVVSLITRFPGPVL